MYTMVLTAGSDVTVNMVSCQITWSTFLFAEISIFSALMSSFQFRSIDNLLVKH
jgi:hypothetical protein